MSFAGPKVVHRLARLHDPVGPFSFQTAARAMKHIIHCLFSILLKPNKNEWKDILERMHRRRKKSSTIFCSQFKKDEWYEQLGGEAGPLADTIWPSHS